MTFPYAGAIDADGHVLEPPDLWETYIDPRYRDRALRVRRGDDGGEYIEIAGAPAKYFVGGGQLGFAGAMRKKGENRAEEIRKGGYIDSAPFGSRDAKERVALLDRERIDKAILYPTLGIIWEPEVDDPELAAAYARAYNRWIVDFCSDSGGRLVAIAHISMGDGEEAARELERAVRAGAKGAFVAPYTIVNKSHAHPDFDRFWATAQELGVPVGIHPCPEPPSKRVHQRFHDLQKWALWHFNVHGGQGPLQAFTALFQHGLFDRFPEVRVVVLESGAGWAGYLLDRMDAVAQTVLRKSLPLKELPSFYFRRQCWISGDPDERALAHVIDFVGSDRFFWASDFPHPDHPGDYMEALEGLVAPLSESTRRKILGENVRQAYRL